MSEEPVGAEAEELAKSVPLQTVVMLGRDHMAADRYAMCSVGDDGRTVCSLSLGGLAAIPRKGGTQVPNEDCLVAADFGSIAFHAVADGHRGYRASHKLVELIAGRLDGADSIRTLVRTCGWLHGQEPQEEEDARRPTGIKDISRTTATLCAIDRESGTVEGWSLGDSAVYHLSLTHGISRLNEPNTVYVTPFQTDPVDPGSLQHFRAAVHPGDILLSCSDGVFECHYGSPETSISLDDLESLFFRFSGDVDAYVAAVSRDALRGVRGNPGGQDNIAVIATVA